MKFYLIIMLCFISLTSYTQDVYEWKRNSSGNSEISLNGQTIKNQYKEINFANDKVVYHSKTGNILVLEAFKTVDANKTFTVTPTQTIFGDFVFTYNDKYANFYQGIFRKTNFFGEDPQIVLSNNKSYYTNPKNGKATKLKELQEGETYFIKENKKYYLFRDGIELNNKRTFSAESDFIVYDTLSNKTYKLPNFFTTAESNIIYYPEEIETEHHTFVLKSEGRKFWVYQKGRNVSSKVNYTYLDDNQMLFIYLPTTDEYYFSVFNLDTFDYSLAKKSIAPNSEMVWFKDGKNTVWVFSNGDFITPTDNKKSEDGLDLLLKLPESESWVVVEGYKTRNPYQLYPIKTN